MPKKNVDRNMEIYNRYVVDNKKIHEIADEYGMSKQRVSKIIIEVRKKIESGEAVDGRKKKSIEQVIYPAIREFLENNNMAVYQFARSMGYAGYSKVTRFLYGDDYGNIKIIRSIMDTTGLKFEEAFATEDVNG